MSFDGLFTKAIVEELQLALKGGRISRIHQPFQNEIVLTVRANNKNSRLLLSAHPQYARVQITEEKQTNPQEPPMFCMVLRKHLEGGFIEKIEQVELDRIIKFTIRSRDEIGDLSYKILLVEIMGRHSNIILLDKEKTQIIDSIKHVPPAINSYRSILPGRPYIYPPEQDKLNSLKSTEEEFLKQIDFNSGRLDRQIVGSFAGISPLLAREIVHNAKLANRINLPESFLNTMAKITRQEYQPTMIRSKDRENFYFLNLNHLEGERSHFESLSQLLDRFYFKKADRERIKQQAQNVINLINSELDKNIRKLKKLEETLHAAINSDNYKLYGELLTAHIYLMKKGMSEIELTNYYDENEGKVKISLDSRKTPAENAQAYFSKYDKANRAKIQVEKQINLTKVEINYFQGLLQQIESAAPEDIQEMREELIEGGYIKERKRKKPSRRNKRPNLEKYMASDKTEIYVGKNNLQNDYLTMRFARQDEIWLHTKDIPGSHVLIRSTDPSNETLLEAASLAAFYSQARQSSSVPVDFTKIRHVRKPRGAKPGYVIYDQQQTIFVTPNEEIVRRLAKN